MFTQHDPSHRKAELLAKNLFFQNKEQSLTHVLKAELGEFAVKEWPGIDPTCEISSGSEQPPKSATLMLSFVSSTLKVCLMSKI